MTDELDIAGIRVALRDRGHAHLESALTDDALACCMAPLTKLRHKTHPLKRLILAMDPLVHDESGLHSLSNTDSAVRTIATRGSPSLRSWLSHSLARLTTGTNYENCSAALAEVRAAGYCASLGWEVEHIKESRASKTLDFRVVVSRNSEFRVEVAAKQMDGDQASLLGKFLRSELSETPRRTIEGVTVREHNLQPAGVPKPYESGPAEVIIRKFSRVKQDSGQATTTTPSILWLDMQDEDWLFISPRDTEPVFLASFDCFWSTGLWHAFYGLEGTPVFMGHCVHPRPLEEVPLMKHDGMFAQTDLWSAAILSLPQCTVLFQHPDARNPLSEDILQRLHRLPRFDFGRSYFAWPGGDAILRRRIDDTRTLLGALSKSARHRVG